MLAYLDHHATTPCDPAVVDAMAPWWSEQFANPASRLYRPALEAAAAVAMAQGQVARALGASPEMVIFTSGATEANNLALKGVCEAALQAGAGPSQGPPRRRLVSLVSEHRAVLDPLAYLERHGFPLTLLPIGPQGQVNLEQLEQALGPDVLLLSVMAANNEIGVVAPLPAIAALCKAHGVLLHCDAAQGAGHIPLSMADLEVDLLSISGHKLYGPKGIGALLVRPGVPLTPQLHGGNQQEGLRAGTLPVPLVVGLGAAVELAMADREARALRLGALRDQLWAGLAALGGIQRNGDPQACLPHNLNITVAGVDGTQLHQRLRRQMAVSSGSACSQGSPSPVLAALGRTRQEAAASIRFGLGRATSAAEIALAIATVREAIHALRA